MKVTNDPVIIDPNKADWRRISERLSLSEEFIERYADRVNWYYISCCQCLSEEFIARYADRVDWDCISYKCLSEAFIERYADRVNWDYISHYQRLSEAFIKRHKYELSLTVCMEINKQTSREEKIQEMTDYAKQHNLEFDGEYLYAFRNHDMWGRGSFSGTTRYEQGKYYRDWRCDMRKDTEDSFGLGIWPKGNTPVRVRVEDWGVCVNRKDGKCRVWGFEIVGETQWKS